MIAPRWCERGVGADHAEARARRIQRVDPALQPRDRRVRERRDQPGAARHGQVAPVAKGRRRDPDQHVPDRAAGNADHDRQQDRTEEVELRAHAGHAATQAEDEHSDQAEHQDESRVDPRYRQGDDGRGGHGQWQERGSRLRESMPRYSAVIIGRRS
jgi:hypothetical protein